jgi:hypothetical protein
MAVKRELRARRITLFFIDNPFPLNKVAKIYYPLRSYKLMKRVFQDNNTYVDEDLKAWEFIIKRIKKQITK